MFVVKNHYQKQKKCYKRSFVNNMQEKISVYMKMSNYIYNKLNQIVDNIQVTTQLLKVKMIFS